MFKKAKYIYAFFLFFIVIALFLFSSNLYAAWIFDTSPPDMKEGLYCGGEEFDSGGECAEDNVDITLECSESGIGQSGCETINYGNSILGVPCEEDQTANNPDPYPDTDFDTSFSIPNDGETYTICIESIDRAGNIRIGGSEAGANPIIVFIGSWFKLKDASFNSVIGRSINLPLSPQKYDEEDDTLDPYLVIGSGGVVLSPSTYTITDWQYSENDWNNQSYTYKNSFSPENYKDYVLSSREYNEITDLENIQANQINYYVGGVDAGDINVASAPFILLVDGDITFGSDFNTSNNSIALVATGNINIDDTVTSIGGIIAADNINISFGGDSNIPLKITGNIISTNEVNTLVRERTDDRTKPSFFVVFSPKMYIELIDHLSRATYDWKQLQ